MVREKGIDSVSARNIAKELGCSICPIFSCFENMEVLKEELLKKMHELYDSFISEGIKNSEKRFKGSGLAYIKFAKENKNYFKALFMGKNNFSIDTLVKGEENEKINKIICESSGLNKEDAFKLHKYNWIFVHGIAVMLATDYADFSDEEISEMLTEEYIALLDKFKGDVRL